MGGRGVAVVEDWWRSSAKVNKSKENFSDNEEDPAEDKGEVEQVDPDSDTDIEKGSVGEAKK